MSLFYMHNKIRRFFLLFIFTSALVFIPTLVSAKPYNIKTDYCGVKVRAEYCKCAFHNEKIYCDRIGLDSSSANEYVQSGYQNFLAQKQQECVAKKWLWNNNECFPPPTCKDREVFISDKWACFPISDFCGDDPLILYNVENQQCFCPTGYELEKEDGNQVCKKIEEIKLNVQVEPGYPQLPLLADGITKTRFRISATYNNNGNPVDLNFRLDYPAADEAGTLDLLELDSTTGYVLEYITPDASDFAEGRFPSNSLKITYHSFITKADDVIRYDIPLFTSQSETIIVSKEGFERKTVPLTSQAKQVTVFVYTQSAENRYPINQAEIVLAKQYSYTNEDGRWTFELATGTAGAETIEVQLDLAADTYTRINTTKRIYRELGLFHDEITSFLTGIKKELAAAKGGDDARNVLAKLKSLSYSLTLILHGNSFSKTISADIGGGLSSVVWDIIDTVSAVFNFSEKARLQIGKVEAKALNLIPEDYETLKNSLGKIPGSFFDDIFRKIKVAITAAAPAIDPGVIESLYHSISQTGITQGAQAVFNFADISGLVENSFYNRHLKFSKAMVAQVASGLRTKTIDSERIDALGSITVSDFSEFTQKYSARTDSAYTKTFIRDVGDLIRGTVIEGLSISFPGAMTAFTKALDGVWGGVKTLISADIMVSWYNAYADNQSMVKNGINTVMHVVPEDSVSIDSVYSEPSIVTVARAATVEVDPRDHLQAMYDNQAAVDDPNRKIVVENYEAKVDLDFYSNLATIITIVEKMDPQNQEAAEVKANIDEIVQALKQTVNETNAKVNQLDIVKPQTKGSVSYAIIFWVVVILLIPWMVFIVKRSKSKRWWQKIGRIILGIFVWLILISVISFFIGRDLEQQINMGVSEVIPTELNKQL